MNRRQVLQSALAGGAAASALTGHAGQTTASANTRLDEDLDAVIRATPPMNLARAYRVLEQENLDGLVLGNPLNVYHLTGYWPQLAKMGYPTPAFALLAADTRQAPGLVMSQFIYYYNFADAGFEYPLQTYLYGGWGGDSGEAIKPYIFADLGQEPLGAIEQRRRAVLERAVAKRPLFGDIQGALVKALRDLGLNRGRIGADHATIAAVFESQGCKAELRPAENTLRKIRLVKSPHELALMRRAATNNAQAALTAARSARAGATYQELRAQFFAAAAEAGNHPVFMSVDRMSSELGNAEIREGQCFFIDCVSHLLHYHGDYGRTIFVGEPAGPMRRAAAAIAFAWDAVRERLRPGLRYSEIKAIGNASLKKAGYPFDVAFTPHSVGLMHTDEPGRDGTPFFVKDDLVLEENMILSVDCPVRNTGIGGSAHLEDLTWITRDGAEQINNIGDRIIVV